MITVTERAKHTLERALVSTGVKDPEIGLRLKPIAQGEYNLVPDKKGKATKWWSTGGGRFF